MRNGEYQYYFTALWLSGQFERAVEVSVPLIFFKTLV